MAFDSPNPRVKVARFVTLIRSMPMLDMIWNTGVAIAATVMAIHYIEVAVRTARDAIF